MANPDKPNSMKSHQAVTVKDQSNVDNSIITMRQALLGITEVEAGVLENLKTQLDQMLNSIYAQVQRYQKVASKDAMLSEMPITQADKSLLGGLNSIANELSLKNQEILQLQRSLALLGLEATGSMQSVEMLRQQLDELNKRNKILRAIHQQLAKHPIITGQIPRGITIDNIKKMIVQITNEVNALNASNQKMKESLKAQKSAGMQLSVKEQKEISPHRRGPK